MPAAQATDVMSRNNVNIVGSNETIAAIKDYLAA